jgi:hypothetical protein
VANNFSETSVESYALRRRAFAACAGLHDTISNSRLLIKECRVLMAQVDEALGGSCCISAPTFIVEKTHAQAQNMRRATTHYESSIRVAG